MFFKIKFQEPRCVLTGLVGTDKRLYWIAKCFEPLMKNVPYKASVAKKLYDARVRQVVPDQWVQFGSYHPKTFLLETKTVLKLLKNIQQHEVANILNELVDVSVKSKTRVHPESMSVYEKAVNFPSETFTDRRAIPTLVITDEPENYLLQWVVEGLKAAAQHTYFGWERVLEQYRAPVEPALPEDEPTEENVPMPGEPTDEDVVVDGEPTAEDLAMESEPLDAEVPVIVRDDFSLVQEADHKVRIFYDDAHQEPCPKVNIFYYQQERHLNEDGFSNMVIVKSNERHCIYAPTRVVF